MDWQLMVAPKLAMWKCKYKQYFLLESVIFSFFFFLTSELLSHKQYLPSYFDLSSKIFLLEKLQYFIVQIAQI